MKQIVMMVAATLCATSAHGQTRLLEQRELLARAAIDELVSEYSWFLDHGETAKLADMFTVSGVFTMADTGTRLDGREAIRAYYAKRLTTRTTRHVSTNLRVVFERPDRARVTRYLTYFAGEGTVPLAQVTPAVAEYEEVVERGKDGRWLFASRIARGVFGGPPKTTR